MLATPALAPGPTLTPAEIADVTGKRRAAAQAAALARLGIPFVFSGRSVRVDRLVALAHALIPEARVVGGVDLSKVR